MARGRPFASKKARKVKSKGDTISDEKWATLKSFGTFVGKSPYLAINIWLTQEPILLPRISILFNELVTWTFPITSNKSVIRKQMNHIVSKETKCTFWVLVDRVIKLKIHFSVAILPDGRDPEERHELPDYWIGKIKDIRAFGQDEDGSSSVCSLLHFFFNIITFINTFIARCGLKSSGSIQEKM